ncbi:MAG TPA: alpha/beta hydrolase [Rhizomicrobium sp.]
MSNFAKFVALIGAFALGGTAQAAPAGAIKNIVLVHGAFADGSGWKAVADILKKDGYEVSIVQPPETSLEDDVAATNRALDALDGPAVLVGHSYGGVIITEAGNNAHAVRLVYVAAFQPDTGESLGSLAAKIPPASKAVTPTKDGFLFIDPAHFHADFAADLPAATADFMARSQVFVSVKSASTPVTSPAWKTKPSYAIVATQDRSINPDLERFMYKRSGSTTIEVKSSHVAYISQPRAVAAVIEKAATH